MDECIRGFLIIGPRTHSRRGIWKVSQPEILLSLAAMPVGALTLIFGETIMHVIRKTTAGVANWFDSRSDHLLLKRDFKA